MAVRSTPAELLADIVGARGAARFDSAHAARQVLLATLHRCGNKVWARAFPNEPKIPEALSGLDDPETAASIVSPQLAAVLLESIVSLPFNVDTRTYQVTSSMMPSANPFDYRTEPAVGQKMPLFAHFCRDVYDTFGITSSYWLQLYFFACSSLVHGRDASATLGIYLDSIRRGERGARLLEWLRTEGDQRAAGLIVEWMKAQDKTLFGDGSTEQWKTQYCIEWQILSPYLRVSNLPKSYHPMPRPPSEAPPKESPAKTEHPPARPPSPPLSPRKESLRGQGPAPPVPEREIVEEPEAPKAAEEKEEEEEVPESAASESQLSTIPRIETIAKKCKRSSCSKIDHELLRNFLYRYGLDANCRSDHAYRLALFRLFANSSAAREALISQYFLHPQNIVHRLDQRVSLCDLEKDDRMSPAAWHSFLSPFDSVHHARDLDLLSVDAFNDCVNAVGRPGERATADSVRIKRFLTAYRGGTRGWRPLWHHAWGTPSHEICASIDGYLKDRPCVDPRTLQRIAYLVPNPK